MNLTINASVAEKTRLNEGKARSLSPVQDEILTGLTAEQKYISSKFFYKGEGDRLFNEICRLPEYYPTRTEISILEQIAPEIMGKYSFSDIVELGSGEALKIKILMGALNRKQRENLNYIPVDISEKAISDSQTALNNSFPEIVVKPIVLDFMTRKLSLNASDKRLFCFFGSTIGNLNEEESIHFLSNIATEMTERDHFLLGFDNIKDINILEPAYNDSKGVTAEFNKNILGTVNETTGADFNPDMFEHYAFYNEYEYRIEMHLVAKEAHGVWIESASKEIFFKKGETIHTENSRKYTNDMIRRLVGRSGLRVKRWHTDPNEWFTVAELKKDFS